MNRELFVSIINVVEEYDNYFVRRMNATGQFGLRCFQNVTTVFHMLTYEIVEVVYNTSSGTTIGVARRDLLIGRSKALNAQAG
jgi:hypothetical protein